MHDVAKKYLHLFQGLQPGDIAIDCGANVGDITELMASTGAVVHSFEPNPFAYAILQKRFAGNPLVTCHNKAILDEETQAKIYFHENSDEDEVHWSTGTSLLKCKCNVNTKKFVTVDTVDLAALIQTLNRPIKLLKIDVEGVECRLLNRLIDTGMHERIAATLVEMHPDKIPEIRVDCEAITRRIDALNITNIHLDWM